MIGSILGWLRWHLYDKRQPSPFQPTIVKQSLCCDLCGKQCAVGSEVRGYPIAGVVHLDCLFQEIHERGKRANGSNVVPFPKANGSRA